MKNVLSFFIFLLFSWLAIWWYYSCEWCLKNPHKSTTVIKESPDSNAKALAKQAYEDSITLANNTKIGLFAKNHQGQDIFRYPENLQINSANGTVYIPNSLKGFSKQTADYLGQHQDQELIISGYQNTSENQDSSSLGISRANFIKDILIKAGINSDRIITKVQLHDYTYSDNGVYNGGIELNFNTLTESRIIEVEKSIASRTLYSGFAQKTFEPDATLSNYTLELKSYLKKYPNKSVKITGHTDDVGDEETNLWYGQQRANHVKEYLISQGVAITKIKALSMGESNPIVPNDTEENKAKNRRIEITVN
ncbi:OmpA family protein [Aquimarina longa]|uniref:OmpA family protein n=1 Tax=Aquimarina longa TaxID=1080221 RepID=UPI000783D594|nr:OmpA family protein [Aquimarina longa]